VAVTQTVRVQDRSWQATIRGVVESCEPAPTGSWHAHGKEGRLWLRRLRLRQDDGELAALVVDENTEVKVLDD
jgi:hypothetical protein